jgi:hypothetical protein
MSRPATKTLRAALSTRSRVSLRHFTEVPDRELQFQERDGPGFMSLPAGFRSSTAGAPTCTAKAEPPFAPFRTRCSKARTREPLWLL